MSVLQCSVGGRRGPYGVRVTSVVEEESSHEAEIASRLPVTTLIVLVTWYKNKTVLHGVVLVLF